MRLQDKAFWLEVLDLAKDPRVAALFARSKTGNSELCEARPSPSLNHIRCGTSFGTCVLHVSPESAIGGELALIENGDLIELDIESNSLNLLVDEEELQKRRANWVKPKSEHVRGWPALYREHVLQADQGCDLDFLRPKNKSELRFIPPVVGRS